MYRDNDDDDHHYRCYRHHYQQQHQPHVAILNDRDHCLVRNVFVLKLMTFKMIM